MYEHYKSIQEEEEKKEKEEMQKNQGQKKREKKNKKWKNEKGRKIEGIDETIRRRNISTRNRRKEEVKLEARR